MSQSLRVAGFELIISGRFWVIAKALGVGLQERAPNHLRRLWSKAMVVSTEGKGPARPGQVSGKKRTTRKPLLKCRKLCNDVKTAALSLLRDKLRRNLFTGGAASGMRGGLSLPTRRICGTWEPEFPMLTEKPQAVAPRGRVYGCGDSGAGQLVVAMKSPIKGWSKGAVSRSLIQ